MYLITLGQKSATIFNGIFLNKVFDAVSVKDASVKLAENKKDIIFTCEFYENPIFIGRFWFIFLKRLNSKAQTLTYIECRINASVGTNVIKSDTIIDGHIPENRGYIPVVIGHSNSNDCFDYIFYDGGRWLIRTNIAQRLNIRFYKCIK